jgi:hypothetical protein
MFSVILLQRSYSTLSPELRDTKTPAPRDTRCSDICWSTSSMVIMHEPSFEGSFSFCSSHVPQLLSAYFYKANLGTVVIYLTLSFAFPPWGGHSHPVLTFHFNMSQSIFLCCQFAYRVDLSDALFHISLRLSEVYSIYRPIPVLFVH